MITPGGASAASLRITEGASGTEYVISTSAMPPLITACAACRARAGSAAQITDTSRWRSKAANTRDAAVAMKRDSTRALPGESNPCGIMRTLVSGEAADGGQGQAGRAGADVGVAVGGAARGLGARVGG